MVRLKMYVTSLGFFERAIAVPSMTAAINAFGLTKDAFKKGFVRQTDDQDIIQAVLKNPGVVLQRPLGTKGSFVLHANLPTLQNIESAPGAKKGVAVQQDRIARKSAADLRREKELSRQQQMRLARLQRAEKAHDARLSKLDQDLRRIQEQIEKEGRRWQKQKNRMSGSRS